MLHPFRSMAAVCVLTLMCSAAIAQDLVDNPAYQSWAKFKAGTTVTLANDSNMGGMAMKMDLIYKLAELTPEKAVIEMTTRMPQGDTTSRMEILAKVKKEDVKEPGTMPPNVKGQAKVLPDEDVKIGDKTYKCKVVEFTSEIQGMKTTGKSWTCQDMPGQLVKMETTMAGAMEGTTKMTVTAVDAK
jgi:hypothetical protein